MRVSWIVVLLSSLMIVVGAGCKKDKPKPATTGQKGDKIEGIAPAKKGEEKPAAKKGDPDVNKDDDDGKPQPYTLTVTPPAPGKVGTPLVAAVKVTPAEGYKVNLEYPTKLEITSPKGGNPDKVVLKAKQAAELTEKVLLLKPSFKMPRTGDHIFKGKLKFSVCTEKLCEIKKKKVQWVAKVTE